MAQNVMTSSQFSCETLDVLHLLMNAVLADAVIHEKEITLLCEVAKHLNLTDNAGMSVSHDSLKQWITQNYTAIYELYSGEARDIELIKLFMRLDDRSDKPQLLAMITEICHADGNYHQNEKVLISLIESYWS